MTNKDKAEKKLHPRNKHHQLYDMVKLVKVLPELKPYIIKNPSGDLTIPFAEPKAVKLLNKALLLSEYHLDYWELPKDQLCPPIPGRADYIHYLADLLAEGQKSIPRGADVRIMDVGIGANAIYPIIGVDTYGWSFVGTDVSRESLTNADNILYHNPRLDEHVTLRLQPNKLFVLRNVIEEGEHFDAVICNPPFYASAAEANAQTTRKVRNLGTQKGKEIVHNFGGKGHELWCKGGEVQFINTMIKESVYFAKQVKWFTTLISNNNHIEKLEFLAKRVGATETRVVEMQQGNKQTRFLAWRF